MKQIFVNSIHKEEDRINGIAVLNHTVEEDLRIIFDKYMLLAIMKTAEGNPSGMHTFVTYCQYIVLVQVKVSPNFDGALNFIDCNNSLDSALDLYLLYTKNNWGQEVKAGFMKAFQKIQDNPPAELAEMIIKDPFPL